jgi:hypothetical protein
VGLVTFLEERVSRVWLGVAGLALIAVQGWLNFRGDLPTFVATFTLLPGLAFLAASLVLWGRDRISVFLGLTAFAWIFSGLGGNSHVALLNGFTLVLQDLWRVLLAHTAFAHPEGKLREGLPRVLIPIGYAFILVGGLIGALAFAPYEWESCECPRNAFAIFHSKKLSEGIDNVYGIIGAVLELVIIVLLVRLFARSPGGERRLHSPLLVTAAAFALLLAVDVATKVHEFSFGIHDWLYFFVHLGLVAAAISYPLALRKELPAPAAASETAAPAT